MTLFTFWILWKMSAIFASLYYLDENYLIIALVDDANLAKSIFAIKKHYNKNIWKSNKHKMWGYVQIILDNGTLYIKYDICGNSKSRLTSRRYIASFSGASLLRHHFSASYSLQKFHKVKINRFHTRRDISCILYLLDIIPFHYNRACRLWWHTYPW